MENQRMNKGGYLLFNELIINNIYCIFFALCFLVLLSDAEPGENSTENIVRRNISGNLSQVRYGISNVYSQKIC